MEKNYSKNSENLENLENFQNNNEELNTSTSTLTTITLPIKSSCFYYDGNKISSDIKFLKLEPVKGILSAQGVDQFGEFILNGKIISSKKAGIFFSMEKIYDSHDIEITLNLNLTKKKLEGHWKSYVDTIYDVKNTFEIELELEEYDCEVLITKQEQGKMETNSNNYSSTNKILCSLVNDNSGQDYYVGFLFSSERKDSLSLNIIEANVYDVTHVIYSYSYSYSCSGINIPEVQSNQINSEENSDVDFEKKYFSGKFEKFDEKSKKLILEKTEVI